jgi:hypothetical protein
MFPLALGAGQRRFDAGSSPVKLSLAGTEAYESGVVDLTYRMA